MMVFMFPETRYSRQAPSTHARTSSSESTTNEFKPEGPPFPATTMTSAENGSKNLSANASDHISDTPLTHHIVGRPSKAQFSINPHRQISREEIKRTLLLDILAPIQIVTYPIILWVFLAFAFTTNCLLSLNLTQSQVFAAPPYNFSPAAVGFVNFAFVVGGIVGLCTAGPISDWLSLKLAKRNGGVREAEMRLWVLIPYIAICLVGMVVRNIFLPLSIQPSVLTLSYRLQP